MEMRQLRYFIAIAQHGSFSSASARIRVAQPALSSQIAALENEFGQPLLHRHSRGVRLTAAGETFLAHAVAIMARVDEATRELSTGRHPEGVTIGITPLISRFLSVPLVEAAARELPGLSLQIIEGMSGAQRGWLDNHSIDLSFMLNMEREDPMYSAPILAEDLYAVGKADAFFPDGEDIHESSLLRLPVIASTRKNSHRVLLERISRRYGVPLSVVAEVDSIPRQRELVEMGKGVLAIPLSGLSDWNKADLSIARLTGEEITWETSLTSSGSQTSLDALRLFRPLALSLIDGLIRTGQWPGATLIAGR